MLLLYFLSLLRILFGESLWVSLGSLDPPGYILRILDPRQERAAYISRYFISLHFRFFVLLKKGEKSAEVGSHGSASEAVVDRQGDHGAAESLGYVVKV